MIFRKIPGAEAQPWGAPLQKWCNEDGMMKEQRHTSGVRGKADGASVTGMACHGDHE